MTTARKTEAIPMVLDVSALATRAPGHGIMNDGGEEASYTAEALTNTPLPLIAALGQILLSRLGTELFFQRLHRVGYGPGAPSKASAGVF